MKENKCKVKRLDKEEEFSYVEVLQHIIMLLLNTLTIQHPLTTIHYRKQLVKEKLNLLLEKQPKNEYSLLQDL